MKIRNKPLAISVLMIRPGEISPIEFKTLIHHHQPFHSVVIEQGDTPSFIIADMENQRSGAKIHRVPSVGSVGQKNGDPRIPVRDFYPEIVTDIFHVIMEDLYSEPQELRKLIRVLVIADATIWNIHSDIFSKRSSKSINFCVT